MRFLKKRKIEKTIIVISDIHLGAGKYFQGQRNYLEDFHFDEELVDFLAYFSKGDYEGREVDLIINGDLFDLLAVPFVAFYDDEFWSEVAALEKLRIILAAHAEVMAAMRDFVAKKGKKIIYVIGNHDGEMVFPSMQKVFYDIFAEKDLDRVEIRLNGDGDFSPAEGVLLKHGHEYETAHSFDPLESIIQDQDGKSYFVPPWGSYYVTRVLNKFKELRPHINAVRPIRKFMINGIIYDTLFTLRFALANAFYFFMVRYVSIIKSEKSVKKIFESVKGELQLFKNYEILTMEFLEEREDIDVLIVGHTHEPVIRTYANGKTFINTGTWTKMYNLDFGKGQGEKLTYAQIDLFRSKKQKRSKGDTDSLEREVDLNVWLGSRNLPFEEFS